MGDPYFSDEEKVPNRYRVSVGRTRDDAASDLNLLRAQVSGIAAVLHDGAWIGGESPTFALTLSGLVDEAASTARVVEAQLTGVYDDEPTDVTPGDPRSHGYW